MVPSGFSGDLWLNYRTASWGTDGNITNYHMGNGATGYANVKACGFIKNGYNDNYVLLAGGGTESISSLNVAYATSAGSAGSATTAGSAGYSDKLTIHDVRNDTRLPTYFTDKRVTGWFNNEGTPDSN